jgi:hypothetical protein
MDSTIATKVSQDLQGIRKKKSEVMEQQAKLDQERLRLDEQEKGLTIALKFYQGDTATNAPAGSSPNANGASGDFALLTIAQAAAKIFRSRNNEWMTIGQIEKAFSAQGKKTSYNSIDGTLRSSEDFFERQKVGKQNQVRLKKFP